MQRLIDALYLVMSRILEGKVQLAPDLLVHDIRNADPVGLGQRFQPGGDVDAVAKDVVRLDNNVADVHADAKADAFVFPDSGITADHAPLHFGRAHHGFDNARELDEHPVAGGFDYPPIVLPDPRLEQLAAMPLEALVGAFLIALHKARVAGHVSGDNCGEAAGRGHGGGQGRRAFGGRNYTPASLRAKAADITAMQIGGDANCLRCASNQLSRSFSDLSLPKRPLG